MAIVEHVDSELHLGGPDGVWRAMGLTRRSEKSSQVWNAFQSRHAVLEARDPDTAADVYKATVKAGFEAWKSEGEALDPEAQTQRESELIAWHNQHLLEKEVASTHLPGGRMKQMLKIQSRLGEDATLNLLNLGIFTVSFVVNVSLSDVEATEANAVVHPSKLSHKLFSEKHLHIQEYLNTLAGGLAAEMEDIRHHEAAEALLSKRWWTTVQRDQRENISKFLVNMWNNACSDTQDHWVKPSYAHLLDQLYARRWCIVDYPNDTRPLSNVATNRTLSSRELKSLLQAFDSDTPPRIVPWAADKVAKDGVDLPLANLGGLPLVESCDGTVVCWVHECSSWESVFGKGVEMRVHAKWDRRMARRDAKVSSGPVLNVTRRWSIRLKTQGVPLAVSGKAHKRKDNPTPGEELSNSDAHQIKRKKRAVAPASPLAEELSA
ncbi:hypothetical protein BS47DRAFT_1361997 [Hydnum rufescens UP504]|uniref:Uncharacterized protein n=1 Tax=Hydnum rufescens UP504 TaxID=1448309 RepID=A0A9P6DT90_9AGAM|nr:hypothetical protein BS47DRAFT_1361997 [Hydnum rufescens UP504]